MRCVKACLLLLLVGLVLGFGQVSCNGHLSLFSQKALVIADYTQLRRTVITPVLDRPLVGNQNVIWCGTFQLAWNEVCSLLGEDVRLDPQVGLATTLNKKEFGEKDIDEGSYVALAGFVRDGIYAKIPGELALKFPGKASPRFVPKPGLISRPQDIITYCYLFKNLEFPRPFERLDPHRTLTFDGKKLRCFGADEYKRALIPVYQQVTVLDYRDEDDFVIELKTKSPKDRMILAKIAPAATLGETVRAVHQRLAAWAMSKPAGPEWARYPQPMCEGDLLVIPDMNFDFTRQYDELMGPRLVSKKPGVDANTFLLDATQNIRFEMDEKGVRLLSEVRMEFGCAAGPPGGRHTMIFDKPFLLMLQRADSQVPYFAMWVANGELWP